jgi:tRNA G18 (ribose-2'-O)-methylase SpoU
MNRQLVLIAHNLRSTHNVGSLLRTADGLGLDCVFLTGYTPYPKQLGDSRLPHLVDKLDRQIHKTALGAERTQKWRHVQETAWLVLALKILGYEVAALEQTMSAIPLHTYPAPRKVALIVGREVEGIEPEVLTVADTALHIPMLGKKESFNVVQAAAMALFYLRHL